MEYAITHLPKEAWKGHILRMDYTTSEYYDVKISRGEGGFDVGFHKAPFDYPLTVKSEWEAYPDRLYREHWEGAFAWGIFDGGELIAAIETCPEEWSNRLRVTELWVHENHRRRGLGRALMAVAREQAALESRRAIVVETQSRNTAAISFYLSEGFALSGFDSCCYFNNDIERREVRMDFAWFPPKRAKLSAEDVVVRPERPSDWHETEHVTKRAFWNRHRPGCDEHFLVHKLRGDPAYVPELSRVAEVGGRLVGCIMYSKALVSDGEKETEVLTFGPLCVDPDFQGRHIGGLLLSETLKLASGLGHRAVIIYGEPGYYPRFGFKTCDNFGITPPDGKNFPAFMGRELTPGGLEGVRGKFSQAGVFENLPAGEAEEYDAKFPPLPKRKFPCQWA